MPEVVGLGTMRPEQMQGRLEMEFGLDAWGRTLLQHLYRQSPFIVQQALYFDEQLPLMACLYILCSGGPVIEGDRGEQRILLRPHTSVYISTGAATVVAQMRSGEARLRQRLCLMQGAYLEYLPEPVIPCRGARYDVECEVEVEASATLFYSEIFLSGRSHSGERFCYHSLRLSMRAVRPSGECIFCERMVAEPSLWGFCGQGIMGGWEVMASVVILSPPEVALSLYEALEPHYCEESALALHLLCDDVGLLCRILSHRSGEAKRQVRRICSLLRQRVKGVPLPEEFAWR